MRAKSFQDGLTCIAFSGTKLALQSSDVQSVPRVKPDQQTCAGRIEKRHRVFCRGNHNGDASDACALPVGACPPPTAGAVALRRAGRLHAHPRRPRALPGQPLAAALHRRPLGFFSGQLLSRISKTPRQRRMIEDQKECGSQCRCGAEDHVFCQILTQQAGR